MCSVEDPVQTTAQQAIGDEEKKITKAGLDEAVTKLTKPFTL